MWLGEEHSRQKGQVQQGPGEGMCLVCWRNSKEASVASVG